MTLNRRALLAAAPVVLLPTPLLAAAPAPAISLKDADGRTRTLAEFKGKVVVLEWVNEGCPYVKKHYQGNMQSTQAAAAASGAVWLTICSSAPGKQGHVDGAGARKFIAEKSAKPTAFLFDPDGKVGKAYGAKTTPHMYVIDKSGQIVFRGGIDDKPTSNVADISGATNFVKAALADLKAGRPVKTAFAAPYGCAIKYA